jgi:hypothetical protein
MNPKTKQIIIAVVIIVIAFFVIKSFFPSTATYGDPTLAVDSASAMSQPVIDGQAVVVLLNRLENVDLSGAIFTSVIFKSLKPSDTVIFEENVERRNPFAPVGADGQVAPSRVASSTPKTTR